MARLTYRDFQQRISIQDLLVDAGYHQNLKDGRTYPSYSREKGDKFIVTRNGMACFRPPEQLLNFFWALILGISFGWHN